MDTQWPRFIVFLQERENAPHQYVGSVHAPDAELALLNARDVFVRRPACLSLWVVPSGVVVTKTAQELARDRLRDMPPAEPVQPVETYHVFCKLHEKGAFAHSLDVEAGSAEDAIRLALTAPGVQTARSVWVLPARAALRSTPDDVGAMFAPAHDKTPYRDQAEFRVMTTMQQIKRSQDDET